MPIRAMNPTHPGYGMMQVGISGMMQVGFLTNKSRFVQHHCTRVELRGAKRGSFAREYFKFTHRSTGLLPAAAQRSSNQTQIARDRRSMTVHILVVPSTAHEPQNNALSPDKIDECLLCIFVRGLDPGFGSFRTHARARGLSARACGSPLQGHKRWPAPGLAQAGLAWRKC